MPAECNLFSAPRNSAPRNRWARQVGPAHGNADNKDEPTRPCHPIGTVRAHTPLGPEPHWPHDKAGDTTAVRSRALPSEEVPNELTTTVFAQT
jgi:hypothetical protein